MNGKNTLLKITPFLTLVTWLYVVVVSHWFKVSLDWIFSGNNSFQNHKIWYTNLNILTYFAFKITPIILVSISGALNLTLIFKYKFNILKIFENFWVRNKYGLFFILSIIALLVYPQFLEENKNHSLFLIGFSLIMLVIFFFQLKVSKNVQITILIVLAFVLRLFYFCHSTPIDFREDSMARVSQVYDWLHYGGLPGGLNWPFMHHVLMYLVAKLFNVSIEEGGRIFSLVCSLLLIPFAFNLISIIYNRNVAFFSLFIYSINPFLIKFATIQMTEIPFLFFMVLGIYYALLYFRKNNNNYFIISVCALNIASLMRFEAWIIIPLLFLFFTFRRGCYKKTLMWFWFAMFGALCFMLYSFIKSGNPISGVTASDVEVIETLIDSSWALSLKRLILEAWHPLIFILFLIIGIVYNIINNKNKYLLFIILLLTSYYIFKMITLTLMPFWRYLTFVVFFIIPMFFYLVDKKLSKFSIWVLLFIVYIPYTLKSTNQSYKSIVSPKKGFIESAEYVKAHLNKPNSKFILSISPWGEDDLWIVKSGLYNDYKTFKRLHPGSGENDFNEKFTTNNICKNIIERDFNIILIESGYEIDSVFNKAEVKNYLKRKKVNRKNFGEYTLIEIED